MFLSMNSVQLANSLTLLWKGMLGVFAVMALLSVIVWAMITISRKLQKK